MSGIFWIQVKYVYAKGFLSKMMIRSIVYASNDKEEPQCETTVAHSLFPCAWFFVNLNDTTNPVRLNSVHKLHARLQTIHSGQSPSLAPYCRGSCFYYTIHFLQKSNTPVKDPTPSATQEEACEDSERAPQ
jgi:hypothetical protein